MATTSGISAITGNTAATTATPSTSKTDVNTDPAAAQDRFLKLLVAQLNNQDPMNPLDNAQMTSQIAQINTVTGIQQLNDTVKGLVSQFASQQLMAGSTMVGRQVLVEGNTLAIDRETGMGYAAFDLDGAAASVSVQVLNAQGKEVGTLDMGSLKAGRHNIEWDASAFKEADGPLRFKVAAANGQTAVKTTSLAIDQVTSVNMDGGNLAMQLASGSKTPFSAVKAVM